MGTTEQAFGAPANSNNNNNRNSSGSSSSSSVSNNATATKLETQKQQQQQQEQQKEKEEEQQYAQLPKASPPPQVIIIPTTQASTVATNAAKKIRRAFTMPRNPFRWSRKFKTATGAMAEGELSSPGGSNSAITSCVGGGRGRAGSIVSLNSYEAISKDANSVAAPKLQDGPNASNVGNEVSGNDGGGGNGCVGGGVDGGERSAAKTHNADETNDKIERKIGGKQNRNSTAANVNGNASNATTTNSTNRIFRRSSFRKFLNRIAQHVSNTVNIGANKQTISLHHNNVISNTDRVPPIGGYQWPPDQTPGVMGLKNHGNTCFMNAVLQCLSHTDILAEYFVLDQYKADLKRRNKINSRKFGTKGELTEQLANVLKALWTCKNESDHSTSFKAVVDRYGSQFRSSTQHDAQEFLFWLLDKVHEDLNTATKRKYKSVKNSYGRPDEIIAAETLANHIRCNNSFVQAVFQAQFRSSLTCPRCKKQSNTFDPFHCISVQLPQLLQQNVFVTVVYLKQQPRQVKLGLRVPAGSPIVALREQLQTDAGIASERMVLVDINKEGFSRVFYDTQPIETLIGIETIFCIEVPEHSQPESKGSEENMMTTNKTVNAEPNEPKVTTATTNSSEKSKTITNTATESSSGANQTAELLLLVANVRKKAKIRENTSEETTTPESETVLERFGTPFSMRAPRDCSYVDLQKKLLQEMSASLKPDVFSYASPLTDMFQIRLQCPSADPDSYLEQVQHPLLTEMIDMALSVLSAESGPAHVKLLLEWPDPEQHFADISDTVVEHESFARLRDSKQQETQALSLEQCLEHYTKAETLSAEDAWRCPHCQQYLPVVKTLGLWSLPDILVVHFKRFRQHQEKGSNAAKLTTMVKFPLNAFDMSPHLARDAMENSSASLSAPTATFENYRPSPWRKSRTGDSRSSTLNSRDNKETRYDLYAVCYHQGDTLETGHYTAACKNPYDQQWYKFDDQRVTKVSNDSIQEEIINNEAYMLFYQRRNDNVECSGSSSNSGGDHWVSRLPPPPGATPLPVVEKFTATVEKIITPKAEEAKILEEPVLLSAEVKAIDVPTVDDSITESEKEGIAVTTPVTVKEIQVQMEVNKQEQPQVVQKHNIIDIEKIDYADADDQNIDHIETSRHTDDELAKTASSTKEKSLLTISLNKETPILNAKAQIPQSNLSPNEVNQTQVAVETFKPTENTKPAQVNGMTNGFKHTQKEKLTNGVSTMAVASSKLKSPNDPTSSSSSSSSSSSLSSRSSPHELSTSINGATNLQTKFNGFASTTYASTINSHKEAFLSSSLKSNSSSIIGAHAASAPHNQEFHLSRYQHQNWNGSRFSVSAVENATTAQSHSNGHGLNLRHSFSTSSNYKLRECNETLSSLLRKSTNTCSKDTLLIIDQQTHHHHHHHHHHNHPNSLLEDEDDNFMGSRSLWISPVTPHKLITVSPKN